MLDASANVFRRPRARECVADKGCCSFSDEFFSSVPTCCHKNVLIVEVSQFFCYVSLYLLDIVALLHPCLMNKPCWIFAL